MKEIVDIIMEEKFDPERKKLQFSQDGEWLESIKISLWPGQIYEGSFQIHAPEGKSVYGYISASDSRMELMTKDFAGTEEIHFCFHGEYMETDEVCRGEILIRSNQGEFVLPYEVNARQEEIWSSQGPIRNMIHFANLARTDWNEAMGIFYSPRFGELIREKEPQLYLCYQGLCAVKRNDHNMDQFLIAAGKKQPMSYFVEETLLALSDPADVAEMTLGITRNGWGYTRLDVEAEGDFVFVEKEVVTEDEFLGNRYKLSVYIDSDKLHAGKNFGRILLKDREAFVEVPVEVYRTGIRTEGRELRREKRKNDHKLTDIYQSFRLKEMNTAKWLQETDKLVQRMMSIDEKDSAAKLFFAQILITAQRNNEASWILEHFGEGSENVTPELEAYHLYLSSLLRDDENFTKGVAGEITRIYKERGQSWRCAWLLLFVFKEFERKPADKWLFLKDQFKNGCRSPIIYFEAVQMLNRNPALLRKLEQFELQVLYYGNKKGVLTPELLEQVYYLAGKVKDFSPLLYRILANCYEKTQDERIVKEICTLLIKGNRVEKKYYQWFKLGVEFGVRITNLYEYYMMSLDLEKDEEIPKIVLLYFTYQNNLDQVHAAYLYSYVINHREEYPDIYESYVHRIEGFVKEQVYRARMSEHLDALYHMFLTEDMVQKQNAANIVNILFSYRLKVPGSLIKRIYVYQNGLLAPKVYPAGQDKIWIPIFGKENFVVWEDISGNRIPAGGSLAVNPDLAALPIVSRAAAFIEDNIDLDLYLYEGKEMTYEADAGVLSRCCRLWESKSISSEIRREVAVRIMKYYYHTEDKTNLADYLENLNMDLLTRREAAEVIKYMVYCRMDEAAYEWIRIYSPVLVDSKITASLLTSMIRRRSYEADEYLLKFAAENFSKGKYTNEILRYLSMHFEGSAYDQYQIWKAAYSCGIEVNELGRRLLTQMLFTGNYVEEHSEVFKKYLKDQGEEQLILAYVIRRSYAYYLEGYRLEACFAEFILQQYESGQRLPVICYLACLKYYAEIEILQEEKEEAAVLSLLKEIIMSGVHLPWFVRYKKTDADFSSMLDKAVLEYHAENDGPVKFRFLPMRDDFEEVNWKIVNMYPVCRRVFFTEQVLFFGESVRYEILEEIEGTDVVTKSGILKMGETDYEQCSRYRSINEILEAGALEQDVLFENLLEDYLKKDFLNSHLFKLM